MANPPKNERMFDLRVVDRYIAAGRLERAEYTAHLESIDDVAENVRPREEGGDEDGYDRPIAAANEPRRLPLSALFVRPRVADDGDDDDDDDDFDDDEDEDDDDDDAADDVADDAAPVEAPPAGDVPAQTGGDTGGDTTGDSTEES
jgi:hypothetical protein